MGRQRVPSSTEDAKLCPVSPLEDRCSGSLLSSGFQFWPPEFWNLHLFFSACWKVLLKFGMREDMSGSAMAEGSTCWFSWFKRLFVSAEPEKNPKRWRRLFGRFKAKQHAEIISKNPTICVVLEEQRKRAVTVANATAAAAKAAVAAARAAEEVARLTGASRTHCHTCRRYHIIAAVRIQTAFRAYLARKALRALKGVVRLQAIVRGQAVRRISQPANGITKSNTNTLERRKGIGRSNMELLEKETKIEGLSKREQMKKYSYSFQERRHPRMLEDCGRRSCRLEESSVNATIFSNPTPERRSFCQVKVAGHEISNLPNSPVFPSYMATTESTRAKARSLSTPRLPYKSRCPLSCSYSSSGVQCR